QATAPRLFGENRYLKILREGGAGDAVDQAFQDGLRFSFERASPAVEDVGGGFYETMQSMEKMLDNSIPGLGKGLKAYEKLNHVIDNFMWGRLHAAMKLEVYGAKTEALLENSGKTGKPLTREQAGKIAASYTNDIFGGLNWQRIAEGARTRFGRDLALSALSPSGRRVTQLLLFAPDWTLATTRALTQAFTKDLANPLTMAKGIFSAKNLGDLHRQQLIRSAIYYATIGDAINYSMTGKHLWENKDWTKVELGDGRYVQLSKHFVEPFHWYMHPGQQALNKLGILPKEAAEQAMGVDYLSASGRAPKMDTSLPGRLSHAFKPAVPIGIQQFQQGGAQAGIAGSLGVPIYGMTAEQRRNKRMEDALARFRKHQESLGR
ncbi:MAG: hypothetical protein ACREQ5_26795, partial [Candidatus Dormibacteria bacterium]